MAITETVAIQRAKQHLQDRFPAVVLESTIVAENVAGTSLSEHIKSVEAFLASEGRSLDEAALKRFGLEQPHWLVKFFPLETEDVVSKLHPTFVRVFADGRVELSDY